ncbi:DUF2164 domain-containing protein [Jeotgalibacillus sp. R-1-5s-1]|nr:DUF2164 domain-containing protein [Jeotgalibacillus sp. R-1-5s-1]
MKDPFAFTAEDKKIMVQKIQGYFMDEYEEDIGQLRATLLLDFLLKEIGPAIYNQGVNDSHRFFAEKLEDLFEIQK